MSPYFQGENKLRHLIPENDNYFLLLKNNAFSFFFQSEPKNNSLLTLVSNLNNFEQY